MPADRHTSGSTSMGLGQGGIALGAQDAVGGAVTAHPSHPGRLDLSHHVILYLEGVTVSFDGFKALNGLDFALDVGELRAVIGPNGAGKTTMMDVITGKTRPDSGKVFLGQTIDLTCYREAEIAALGIGRKFQKPTVFEPLSVWENMALAVARDKRPWALWSRRRDTEAEARIAAVLERVRLAPLADRIAGTLSHGQKQWLEIAMLLAQEPKVVLLDEPVAGMTDEETERTAELLLELKGQHSILVVEHDMAFIERLNCRVSVLHEGRLLAEGDLATVQNNEEVIRVYLGR